MNARSKLSRALPLLVLMSLPASLRAQSTSAPVGDRMEVQGGAYWSISVPQLQAMRENGHALLVNVHIPFEGAIPGTDVSIPFNQISDHLDQLPSDKAAPVVLYCKTGPMSVRAATTLVGLGYTRVYTLAGGFKAWEAAGNPLQTSN